MDTRGVCFFSGLAISDAVRRAQVVVAVSQPFFDAAESRVVKGLSDNAPFRPHIHAERKLGKLLIKRRPASPRGIANEAWDSRLANDILSYANDSVSAHARTGKEQSPQVERKRLAAVGDENLAVEQRGD